jgi:hypothetical protein
MLSKMILRLIFIARQMPYQRIQVINNDGELLESKPKTLWINSPFIGAKFQVAPVFQNKFAKKGS